MKKPGTKDLDLYTLANHFIKGQTGVKVTAPLLGQFALMVSSKIRDLNFFWFVFQCYMYSQVDGATYWDKVNKELAKMCTATSAIDPATNAEPTNKKRKQRINKQDLFISVCIVY